MTRGMFDFLQHTPSYTESNKDWYVELSHSTCFWYDLLLHPPEGFDTKQQIKDYLKKLQATVERELDKRFVYFLAARKKVRFCVSKKPRYSLIGNNLIFYVEIGAKKTRQKITTKIFDQMGKPIKPRIGISERFITIHYTEQFKATMPIHDFLQNCSIELGIYTEVHYIGYTNNPSARPINGTHRGLSDMLYKVSNEEHDFFVFYNLFKVTTIAKNPSVGINFYAANSMTNEIKVDEEGRIIEKTLIKYFNTEVQELNKPSEEGELENSLVRLATKNKINSVAIHIEMEEPNEMHMFCSRTVKPSTKHLFTSRIVNGAVEIVDGSSLLPII